MAETVLLPPDIAIDTVVEPTEAALALNRWHGFIPVCPGETAAPGGAVKLINAGESEAWYRHVHGLTADIPALGVAVLDNVTLSGPGYLFRDGAMLGDGSEPYQVARRFAEAEQLPAETLMRRERQVVVIDPVLLICGPGHAMWGHWLLDFLPRLAVAQAGLGEMFTRCVIPVPTDTPPWVDALLAQAFGLKRERLLRYDRRRETLLCRRACVPSHAHHNYFLHSFMADFYRRMALPVADMPRKLFVTRRPFTQAHLSAPHRCAQDEVFETLAMARGFTVVAPETLDFATQWAMFSQAEAIAGISGSGMHNALFAPQGAVVGQLGMPNAHQSRIATVCGQSVAYVFPDATETDEHGAATMQVAAEQLDLLFDALADW